MIHLEPITWDNFWKVIELEVSQDQKEFLPDVAVYMAQSYVNLSLEYSDQCFAIYDQDDLIGFTKIIFVPRAVLPYRMDVDSFMIDAFLIDQKFQGKGYGKKAFEVVLDHISKRKTDDVAISLTCYEKNEVAKKLFTKYDFKKLHLKDQKKGLYIYLKKN